MASRPGTQLEKVLHCSFCGKSQHEVKKLISGPQHVYICDECIAVCNNIIDEDEKPKKPAFDTRLPTPKEIVRHLDEYVIGQPKPKETLAVALYHHYKRVAQKRNTKGGGQEYEKGNMLLIGPTGSGKTLLVKTIARILNVPFAGEDLTQVTEVGYAGRDVDSVLSKLVQNAGGDVTKAEFGVVFLDEIDKITRRDTNDGNHDLGGGKQNSLLKMTEGAPVDLPVEGGRRVPGQETTRLNTENILFIAAGAFDGIEDIIGARVREQKGGSIGFVGALIGAHKKAPKSFIHQVTTEDLVKYGLDEQLIGRFPVRATLDELDQAMLEKVLTEPGNALLKQVAAKIALDDAVFEYDADAVSEIAKRALLEKMGARGLHAICGEIFHETFFLLPTYQKEGPKVARVILRGEHVAKRLSPELVFVTPALPAP